MGICGARRQHGKPVWRRPGLRRSDSRQIAATHQLRLHDSRTSNAKPEFVSPIGFAANRRAEKPSRSVDGLERESRSVAVQCRTARHSADHLKLRL